VQGDTAKALEVRSEALSISDLKVNFGKDYAISYSDFLNKAADFSFISFRAIHSMAYSFNRSYIKEICS
jgi:hypothetical protein